MLLPTVIFFFSLGSFLADPNIRSSNATNEVTPLHIAARQGNLACLEMLVESGGNPLAKDSINKMPRDYAQENGQELCLEFLQKQSGKNREKLNHIF